MILIISEPLDLTTNDVIDWLLAFNVPFIRLNQFDVQIHSVSIDDNSFKLICNGKLLSSENISAVWYRKSYLYPDLYSFQTASEELQVLMENHMLQEWRETIRFIIQHFRENEKIRYVGDYEKQETKLHQLKLALENGLNIPKT